jgi:pSer/pThr/pTyr-binding forkhead associated (FHA) protein
MTWHLAPLSGRKKGAEIPLDHLPLQIGRSRDCQLRSSSAAVSRHHCAVVEENGHLFIQDLASRNGTYVNGERVEVAVELKPHDVVQVGPLIFKVEADEAEERQPEAPKQQQEAVSKTFFIA